MIPKPNRMISWIKILTATIIITASVTVNFVSAQNAITPDAALAKIKEGNKRFVEGKMIHPNLTQEARTLTTEHGQHPYVTIIGCSDSRAPIEAIFDAGIGEIFVIRVAGNVVDTDEAGSIEYGIGHLHTPLLVVLGHTLCGAVTAVTRGDEVHGSIPALVDNIVPAVQKAKHDHGDEFSHELVESAIKFNVWQSIEDLYKVSHEAKELVLDGKLKVIGAIYNLSTGEVEWLGEHPNQQTLLVEKYEGKTKHSEHKN
jgi:carbonic anhydrase